MNAFKRPLRETIDRRSKASVARRMASRKTVTASGAATSVLKAGRCLLSAASARSRFGRVKAAKRFKFLLVYKLDKFC
ncbi:hypothetical protein M2322_003980 [Rhodoblastus acidophilus]|uniref:hypothetical protein n=1 Tax=Rhodoblastus acidophilus TaxID=1074 RepID=UPI00222595C7|nr:hypothetical protein [Rhodoblastus acidophilus]MCW2318411.1 hypothetical protein [Rhodoblastus acidophilus]